MVKVSSRYDKGPRRPLGVDVTTTDDGDDVDFDEAVIQPALDDLENVDAPTPSDGDVLTWNAADGEWQAVPAATGGPLSNYAATTDPTVTDDSGDGYSVGSRWVNTSTDEEFVCTDATGGAAVWVSTTDTGAFSGDAGDVPADSTGYDNSNGTNVQAILDDFDTAISAGGGGSSDGSDLYLYGIMR